MLQKDQTGSLQIRCVFQQGTPLREYVIIQSKKENNITIRRISEAVFDFLVRAGILVCEPIMIPPGNLAGENLLCLFQADLGTEEPIPFIVTENKSEGTISIIQITNEAYDFFKTIGISICLLIDGA